MINLQDKEELLKLARSSVDSYLKKEELKIDESIKKKFSEKLGVFITINENNELRGCIGFPEPVFPLYEAIVKAARSAAFNDPRFPLLQTAELEKIRFEISVLTKPELINVKNPLEYLENIEIGKDGLIIKNPFGSGLLLPQVFSREECNAEKALEMLCTKAFLPVNAWQDINSKIYKFQAEIFSEGD